MIKRIIEKVTLMFNWYYKVTYNLKQIFFLKRLTTTC